MRVAFWAVAIISLMQGLSLKPVFSEALLHVEGRPLRWVGESQVGPTTITYAVLKADYSVPSNKSTLSPSNCAKMHAFTSILSRSPGVSGDAALRALHSAFASWEKIANITFVEVQDPSDANIVIGAEDTPNDKAFANLSYRSMPATAAPVAKALGKAESARDISAERPESSEAAIAIDQAYVCLNPEAVWKVGFDGNLAVYDLGYTFTHEIGHAIGLDHPDRGGALMYYRYDERVQGLQASDIAAAQELYGPRR